MTKHCLTCLWFSLLVCAGLFSCRKDYTPKPEAFFRIEPRQSKFTEFDADDFSLHIPADAVAKSEKRGNELWLTIRLPYYKASLYCTYLSISKQGLRPALEDSHRLAFSHSVKASGISQEMFEVAGTKSGGIIYKIGGDVATPRQFFVTDSTRNFFRASLYFDGKPNADSVAPVVKFIDKDLDEMIKTLRWKR